MVSMTCLAEPGNKLWVTVLLATPKQLELVMINSPLRPNHHTLTYTKLAMVLVPNQPGPVHRTNTSITMTSAPGHHVVAKL